MPTRTAYVPALGDHWLMTEWSSVRHRLPTFHGTRAEAIRSFHDRVRFLTGRGWRVERQRMMDGLAGERRMIARVVPPAEYAHCGDSVIEYRACGGPMICKPCALVQARAEGIEARPDASDPDRATCVADFERGRCRACGQGLRAHMPRYAREAVAKFWNE